MPGSDITLLNGKRRELGNATGGRLQNMPGSDITLLNGKRREL